MDAYARNPFISVIKVAHGKVLAPAQLLTRLSDPVKLAHSLEMMHQAIEDLCGLGLPEKHLVLSHDCGDFGGLWAYSRAEFGFHIGAPDEAWPHIVSATNRRLFADSLLHEAGHVALWWDWDVGIGDTYLAWPGAVEGLATIAGSYACLKYGEVPAHFDSLDGKSDWRSVDAWVDWHIDAGKALIAKGSRGQESVEHHGHSDGSAIVSAAVFDLIFRRIGDYSLFRQVLRAYAHHRRTPAQACRSPQQKMEDFFSTIGEMAKLNIAEYLNDWGFESQEIDRRLVSFRPLKARDGVVDFVIGRIEALDDQPRNNVNMHGKSEASEISNGPSPEEIMKRMFGRSRIKVELGLDVVPLTMEDLGGFLIPQFNRVRVEISEENGFVCPGVHYKDNLDIGDNSYRILIDDEVVGFGEIQYPLIFAVLPEGVSAESFVGLPGTEPAFGKAGLWIKSDQRADFEARGFDVKSGSDLVLDHMGVVIREFAHELLTFSDVELLLRSLAEDDPITVRIAREYFNIPQIHFVLKSMLKSQLSIKKLGRILEDMCTDRSVMSEFRSELISSLQEPTTIAKYRRIGSV